MAVVFDGNNYISIPGYSVPNATTGSVAFSLWVRLDAFNNNGRIFGSGDNMEMLMSGSGNITVDIFGNGSGSVFTLTLGVWTHLIADGNANTDTSRLFVNGALESTNTGQNSTTVGTNLFLGWRDGSGVGQKFTGALDDFRIYSRTLSPNEIQTIFNCHGNDKITFGLQHRYLFNENALGTTIGTSGAVDIGSSRINGTGQNSPLPTRIESILRFKRKHL